MIRIPLKTSVVCSDGPCGESNRVIVHPETLRPTHVVVREAGSSQERLVHRDRVAEVKLDAIYLDCTREELGRMKPFAEIAYREVETPRFAGPEKGALPYAYSEVELIEVRREHVPEGGRAIAKGMRVDASDGKVGTVEELVADPDTGKLTHVLMRERHLWGDKAVVIPVGVVEKVIDNVIYLELDKATLRSYLAVPARRGRAAEEMELIVLLVARSGAPGRMLNTVKEAAERDGIRLYSSAVLVKDEDGRVAIRQTGDMDRRQGALFGAITGGLVGLLGGPAGMIVGAAAGAATGGAAARRIDLGLPDSYLEKLQHELQPGRAAVVALVEAGWEAKAMDSSLGLEADVLQHQLDQSVLEELRSNEE